MAQDEITVDELDGFREALDVLVKNPEQFQRAAEAFEKQDAEAFQSALAVLGLLRYCRWICRWYCVKIWGYACTWLCPPEDKPSKPTVKEMLGFARATLELTAKKEVFQALFEAYKQEDADRFQSILREYKMLRYCRQFCGWFAHFYCRRICRRMCTDGPLITHIGRIPIAQFTGDAYANGPSTPPGLTPAPNPAAGRGDHAFGGLTNIKGLLNIANPQEYKVEYATAPGGPWTLIVASVPDFFPTPLQPYTRSPSAGWYRVPYTPGPPQDGMGNGSEGLTYLTDWATPAGTGDYYLRLTVKNTLTEFTSPIVKVHIDNTWPTIADVTPGVQLELSLKRPDGTIVPLLCCGEVTKEDGLIQIRFQAWDTNFSRYTLNAEGACSLSIPIKETDPVTGTVIGPVSRTYNGNTADLGEPAVRTILWDPWADPSIVKPCCYLVRLRIWDRAVVNNTWAQRHWVPAWTSIQIAV